MPPNAKPQLVDRFGRPLAFSNFYEAAGYSRLRTPLPFNVSDSKTTLTPYTRKQMMSHARYMYANVGFIKGPVDDIALYSVGNGINLKSQIRDADIRAEYDNAWEAWKNVADFYGVFHFDAIQDLTSRAIDIDGDLGAILTEDEDAQARIQMIEAHRIDDFGKGDSQDGVVTDKRGVPVKFRIKDDFNKAGFTEIPADKFVHLFDPERLDERRGKTSFHHAINTRRDVLDILNYEKAAVKSLSTIAAAIKTQSGDVGAGFFGQPEQKSEGKAITVEQLRAGAIPRLNPGEEIWIHDSQRPSATFTGFLDYLDRDAATGLGVPLQFIYIESLSGTAQRFVLVKCQRRFDKRTAQILRFVRRVRFYWAAKEIKRGALPYVEDWWKVRPELPAKISVDVGREAQQNREDLRYGNRTLAEDSGERGVDWTELREQREVEAEDLFVRAARLVQNVKKQTGVGITIEQAIQKLQMDTPNGNSAQAPQQPEEQPKNSK